MNEVAAIGWSVQVSFGGERQPRSIVAQVHMAHDSSPAQINALLDKISRAQDRQVLFYELQAMRDRLKGLFGTIQRYEADLVTCEEVAKVRWERSGRKGEWSPTMITGSEAKAKEQCEIAVRKARDQAIELKQEIERLEASYATGTAVGGADHHHGDTERQDAGHGGTSGAAS